MDKLDTENGDLELTFDSSSINDYTMLRMKYFMDIWKIKEVDYVFCSLNI